MSNYNYFQTLPIETMRQILLDTDIHDLKSMCSTDQYVHQVCGDEDFWKDYIIQNYQPNTVTMEDYQDMVDSIRTTWKNLAYAYEFGLPILIYKSQRRGILGTYELFPITPNMLLSDIFHHIGNEFTDFDVIFEYPIGIGRYETKYKDGNITWFNIIHNEWWDYEDIPIGENNMFGVLSRIYVF